MDSRTNPRPGRPLRGSVRRERASFTLPPYYLRLLHQRSQKTGLSSSELVEAALQSFLERKPSTPEQYLKNLSFSPAEISTFCQRHQIKKLSLFGSVLSSQYSPDSDIDVLIEFEAQPPGLLRLSSIEAELEQIFGGRTVDVRTPDELSRYFRAEVIAEAVTLYG